MNVSDSRFDRIEHQRQLTSVFSSLGNDESNSEGALRTIIELFAQTSFCQSMLERYYLPSLKAKINIELDFESASNIIKNVPSYLGLHIFNQSINEVWEKIKDFEELKGAPGRFLINYDNLLSIVRIDNFTRRLLSTRDRTIELSPLVNASIELFEDENQKIIAEIKKLEQRNTNNENDPVIHTSMREILEKKSSLTAKLTNILYPLQ